MKVYILRLQFPDIDEAQVIRLPYAPGKPCAYGHPLFPDLSFWDGDEVVCAACGKRTPMDSAHDYVLGERGVPWEEVVETGDA